MAASKKTQLTFHESGTILGLKWYWWIVIVVGLILIMSSISLGVGSGGLAGQVSRAFLGFADGILNILSKSPIFWVFAIILLAPLVGRGLCSMVALYKGHFAEGKSQSDANKDMGIDKDTLDEKTKENKDKGISDIENVKMTKSERMTNLAQLYVDKTFDRLSKQIQDGQITIDEAVEQLSKAQKEADDAVDKFNEEHDAEGEHPEPQPFKK